MPVSCETGDTVLVRDVLYFGRNRPDGGVVTDADWLAFVDTVVTSRFPEGLSITEAVGQWRGASGEVERERANILTIFHSGNEAKRQAIADVVAEYRRRFRQEAVLRERSRACVHF